MLIKKKKITGTNAESSAICIIAPSTENHNKNKGAKQANTIEIHYKGGYISSCISGKKTSVGDHH